MRLSNGSRDSFPVVRRQRTQIDNFHGSAFAFELCSRNLGSMDHRAVSNDAQVAALFHQAGLAERNRKIGPGIFRAIVWLTIKMLVLEEHDRVVAARSEEHTSELQSHLNLVCRLLLEKKKR